MSDVIKRLRELHEAATPGPWKAYGTWIAELTAHPVGDPDAPDTRLGEMDEFDADLIAAMRNALPALLDVAEAARFIETCEQHDWDAALTQLYAALDALAKVVV